MTATAHGVSLVLADRIDEHGHCRCPSRTLSCLTCAQVARYSSIGINGIDDVRRFSCGLRRVYANDAQQLRTHLHPWRAGQEDLTIGVPLQGQLPAMRCHQRALVVLARCANTPPPHRIPHMIMANDRATFSVAIIGIGSASTHCDRLSFFSSKSAMRSLRKRLSGSGQKGERCIIK